jgi:signal transduction histidine kinase
MRPHDINKALTRTLFLLESQTLFHNINIVKDLSASLPLVLVDIQQLYHLFMNIILNAAQAMAGNGILTVKSLLAQNEEQVCIEISDTGPGISEKNLPRIFEPFFTTKEEGKGTGLGLSLAYRIVENHGGRIHAESSPGKGTTFRIELPIGSKHDAGDKSENTT